MKKSIVLLIPIFIGLMASLAYSYSSRKVDKLFAEGLKKGDYSEVIQYLKKDIQSHPEDGYNWGLLGKAYFINGQYEEAIAACQKSLSIPHGTYWAGVDREYLDAAYKKLGRFDLAVSSRREAVDSALEGKSKNAGNINLENSYNNDLKLSLIKLKSNLFEQLTSYLKSEQFEEAIKTVKEIIALTPDDPSAFILLARCCVANSRYDEAIDAAKRAIELKSDSPEAYNNLGVAYRMKKQYAEAETAFKKAIEIDPAKALYLSEMGKLFLEKEDYAKAIAAFNKAIEAEPANIEVNLSRAMTYYTMGNYDDAITALDTILAWQTPLAALSYGFRSSAYRQKGSLDAALQDAEKAFSIDPGETWALLSLGAADLDRGRYDESIKLLSQVKESPQARILEATAYAKQGKIKEAQEIYSSISDAKMSVKNKPLMTDRRVLMQIFDPLAKKHLIKAKSFESKGQFKEALSELSEALKIADETEGQTIKESLFSILRRNPSLAGVLPEEARRNVLRGEMLVKEGSFEKAAAEFKQAIRIAPYAARLYYNLSLVYAELKNYLEAIRQMKTYLQAMPDAPDARAAMDQVYKWEFMMEKTK